MQRLARKKRFYFDKTENVSMSPVFDIYKKIKILDLSHQNQKVSKDAKERKVGHVHKNHNAAVHAFPTTSRSNLF